MKSYVVMFLLALAVTLAVIGSVVTAVAYVLMPSLQPLLGR